MVVFSAIVPDLTFTRRFKTINEFQINSRYLFDLLIVLNQLNIDRIDNIIGNEVNYANNLFNVNVLSTSLIMKIIIIVSDDIQNFRLLKYSCHRFDCGLAFQHDENEINFRHIHAPTYMVIINCSIRAMLGNE